MPYIIQTTTSWTDKSGARQTMTSYFTGTLGSRFGLPGGRLADFGAIRTMGPKEAAVRFPTRIKAQHWVYSRRDRIIKVKE